MHVDEDNASPVRWCSARLAAQTPNARLAAPLSGQEEPKSRTEKFLKLNPRQRCHLCTLNGTRIFGGTPTAILSCVSHRLSLSEKGFVPDGVKKAGSVMVPLPLVSSYMLELACFRVRVYLYFLGRQDGRFSCEVVR